MSTFHWLFFFFSFLLLVPHVSSARHGVGQRTEGPRTGQRIIDFPPGVAALISRTILLLLRLLLWNGGHGVCCVRTGLSTGFSFEGNIDIAESVYTRFNSEKREAFHSPVSTESESHGSCCHWISSVIH